ncbi:ERI1 exoribonuclease 2-like [Schistocerca gregaria]|uniref:ERI1 exoribonuclease 2-like n=1 Tax=Schistocerca gregaria TaxID=7010 RepID=UPI00211EBBAC|nr:ERI1 exoribonuclease 2-like [Schistocerca gregaria]
MNHELIKQLARKHGCLERVPIGSSASKPALQKPDQMFDYVIVIDFESTCWDNENKFKYQPEVIEFPAVLLNTKSGAIEDEFQQYVMPTENPKLSRFCRTFTGIKQEQVDAGVPLATCLLLFSRWIKKITEEKSLIFHKKDSIHKSCTFVTWSDWDLSTCLDNECRRKNLLKPEILNQWIDLRATYKAFYKRQPKGLNGAMSEVGLQFKGRQHSGISDARNTAALVHHLVKDGAILSITKVLQATLHTNYKSVLTDSDVQTKYSIHDSVTRKGMVPHHQSDTPVSSRQRKISDYQGTVGKMVKGSLWHNMTLAKGNTNSRNQVILKNCTMLGERTPLQVINRPASDRTQSPKQKPGVSNRATPPLCNCGRRALRKIVSMLGPNQGRSFFICSHRRTLGTTRKSGCDYFKWVQ